MKRGVLVLCALFVLLVTSLADAHKPSDSYLTITTLEGSRLAVRWDIALRDLAMVMNLDSDNDGKITTSELDAKRASIEEYALQHLTIRDCPLRGAPGRRDVSAHSDGTYVVLDFEAACGQAVPQVLAIDYRLFFDIDAQHRGLLRLDVDASSSRSHVFSAKEPTADFDLASRGTGQQLRTLLKEGILHIWTGYDHVLFLIALLLPSVLRREEKGWTPVAGLRVALLDVLRIVTAFTIAHSITLSLAAFGIVVLPSRLVESAIAASVVLAALNNLRPILEQDRWVAAFLLGLMHGFGFSSALADLGLPRSNLLLTLFGFNLGVELGQVAIVCVFVPLAFMVRGTNVYRRGALAGGSAVILVLAAVWLVERAGDVRIL